ncbi:uncharacterized protein LOC116263873 [Nymphaea colorata]|uniref:uncharacterized protein LOC116263873 n=1 Tax=Nymphaea colorata TaxID=210225 RepID=UPI00129E1158|nr:uncharacterized protein LOC116263873 [Nymphaea colorata]
MESACNSLASRPLVNSRPPRPGTGRPRFRVRATSRRDSDDRMFGSRMVDENMIVLRKRIQEMKMVERNYEAPAHWMEWEKRYYASYDSDVCEGVGQLQRFLMGTRPSVALGLLLLLGFSVPTSVLVALLNFVELGQRIVDVAIHQ